MDILNSVAQDPMYYIICSIKIQPFLIGLFHNCLKIYFNNVTNLQDETNPELSDLTAITNEIGYYLGQNVTKFLFTMDYP